MEWWSYPSGGERERELNILLNNVNVEDKR